MPGCWMPSLLFLNAMRACLMKYLGSIFWIACLLLTGCTAPRRTAQVWEGQSAADILTKAAAYEAQVASLEAVGKVRVFRSKKRESFLISIAARRPDKFDMVAYSRVGPTLFHYLMDGPDFKLYIPSESRLVCGSSMGGFSEWGVLAEMMTLYYKAAWAELENLEKIAQDAETLCIRGRDSERRTYDITVGKDGLLKRIVFQSNRLHAQLTLERRKLVQGVEVAHVLRIKTEDDFEAVLEFRRMDINLGLEDSVFQLTVPPGTVVEDISQMP